RHSPRPWPLLLLNGGAAVWNGAWGREVFRTTRFSRFTRVRARFLLAICQATVVGRRHLKAPPLGLRKSRFRSAEKAKTKQTDQYEIDRNDDVEKTRDDENQNTGNQCNDRLQMRNADGHDPLPFFGWQCD